ncbi:hypothetical protein H0266_11620 [Halobacillus locisalis]|uniref:Uncharacterized protein n=1 Tax=Halobacillus locisalis TaxID=220753 RepID=A0A838CTR9_9BACI|nr:hypothetical protein [Halobacillus locisalis]MBA2175542.1 hypothetical protein [Halobacillus locisalis]
MTAVVKDKQPILKDVAGIAKALKIDAEQMGEKDRHDLELVIDTQEGEKRFSFTYKEDKEDYRILQIPMVFSDEAILAGRIEPKAVNVEH